MEFAERSETGGLDPIVSAACLAFGFVFIHPFEDGNGRTHRWLLHHVLARRGFTPAGVNFPVRPFSWNELRPTARRLNITRALASR
jgi:Fic family protein